MLNIRPVVKATRLAILVLCLIAFAANQSIADGLVFRPIDYKGSLNERAQEAIIIFNRNEDKGNATQDLILKISVESDEALKQFGWVVPLPSVPETGKEDAKLFAELHRYVQMRLSTGRGSKGDTANDAEAVPKAALDTPQAVEVISREVVGEFDVAIVKENVAGSLNQWLADNKFQPIEGAEEVIEWYRKKKYVFACMRVNDASLSKGKATDLHPLRFTFATGGTDGIFFPMRLTGLQEEPFDINLYVFYGKWINDRLSPYGYIHSDFNLRFRDYDSRDCKANAGKLWAAPKKDPYLKPYAHVIPTVSEMFQALHPKERYYLTNIYCRNLKPADVLEWKDDLWLFPYYTNRNFVPYDAREGGVASLGYE